MSDIPSSFNLEYQNQSTNGKIVVALERISEAFRVLLWQESKIHKLSPIQLQILIFLLFHEASKRKVSYLAHEFNMTKATISDAVKMLAKKELIRKEVTPTDSRSYMIHLTEKGKTIAQQASTFSQSLHKAVNQLSQEQSHHFYQSMLHIIDTLKKEEVIEVQRMCDNCRYYAQHEDTHFCNLLNTSLATHELRIDCPEHIVI